MRLIRFNDIKEDDYNDYMAEWEATGELIVPWATSRKYEEFIKMMHYWEDEGSEKVRERGLVPATLYFMVEDSGRIIGAIHFRHELNDRLRQDGGHIGYGIRPSERGKGYGKKLLAMMLYIAGRKGYEKVMLSCDDSNIGSAKVIEANGGVLESRDLCDQHLVRRYWISLEGKEF